jgi:hypothetical protein
MTDLTPNLATPNLALPEIIAAQAQKHVTHNEALRALDALVQLAVLDRDLTAPPASPNEGDRWLVAAGAGDDWLGHDAEIAAWQDGGWTFYTPNTGWVAYVIDESLLVAWDGAAWQPALDLLGSAAQNMALLGVGTTADTVNPFSAKLNNALWVAKAVAEGGDGTLRYKLSKESADKTLSLLFQSNFSGCAELGLTGDDDFHVKVSADGTTWRDAIVIDRSTGAVTMPNSQGVPADLDLTLAGLSLGLADALNVAQFLGSAGNRVADSFDALTYVDTAGASNLDTATSGVLKPQVTGSDARFPTNMTANNVPSPNVVSASLAYTGHDAYVAFDGSAATTWEAYPGATNETLQIDLGAGNATTVATYTITAGTGGAATVGPKSWTFDGSNDATSWTTLDTRTGAANWSSAEVRSFALAATSAAYRYFRLRVTAGIATGDYAIGALQAYGPSTTANMTVCSTILPAVAMPLSAKLVARTKHVDTVTLGTDLIIQVSRDGGTTWTAATMTDRFAANAIHVLDSGVIDLSGQPSGTSMQWCIETANNKMIEIHDIYLYWA